jgi:hypothetical protein
MFFDDPFSMLSLGPTEATRHCTDDNCIRRNIFSKLIEGSITEKS